MLNFILCVFAIVLAIQSAFKKDIECFLLEATIVSINLPFAIAWLVNYFI